MGIVSAWAMLWSVRIMLVVGALVLAHWVFNDARDRGKSPWLITALVVMFFPLGLLLWLSFRPEDYTQPES